MSQELQKANPVRKAAGYHQIMRVAMQRLALQEGSCPAGHRTRTELTIDGRQLSHHLRG